MAATTRSGHRPATKSSSNGHRPTAAAATGKGGSLLRETLLHRPPQPVAATSGHHKAISVRPDLVRASSTWPGLQLVQSTATTVAQIAVVLSLHSQPGRGPAATFLDLLRADLKPLPAIWSGLPLVRPPSTTPSPAAVGLNTNPGRLASPVRRSFRWSAMGVALVRNLMGRSYGSFCSTKPRRR